MHAGLSNASRTKFRCSAVQSFAHSSPSDILVSCVDRVWFAVQGEEQGAMSISLPRVSSAELLLFPETAEGHVSKVIKAVDLPAMTCCKLQGFV